MSLMGKTLWRLHYTRGTAFSVCIIMKIIPTFVHGFIDYVIGIFLMMMPWLFDFPTEENETLVPAFVGAGIVAYSLATNYEYGAMKIISMNSHRRLDYLAGCVLALSPWLFGFHKIVYLPHLVIGFFIVVISFFSKSHLTGEKIRRTRRKTPQTHSHQV
jgi:hypothetical protein